MSERFVSSKKKPSIPGSRDKQADISSSKQGYFIVFKIWYETNRRDCYAWRWVKPSPETDFILELKTHSWERRLQSKSINKPIVADPYIERKPIYGYINIF